MLQGTKVNVTAIVAACTVGAMASLLLLVIVYTDTHTRNDGQNDQSNNFLQCLLRSHLAEIISRYLQCCYYRKCIVIGTERHGQANATSLLIVKQTLLNERCTVCSFGDWLRVEWKTDADVNQEVRGSSQGGWSREKMQEEA